MGKLFKSALRKTYYSITGFWISLKEERSLWFYIILTPILIGLGVWAKLSTTEWAIVMVSLFITYAIEVINTALEAAVDTISFQYNVKVKKIKDIAAGATLVMSIGLIITLLIIYIPAIMEVI